MSHCPWQENCIANTFCLQIFKESQNLGLCQVWTHGYTVWKYVLAQQHHTISSASNWKSLIGSSTPKVNIQSTEQKPQVTMSFYGSNITDKTFTSRYSLQRAFHLQLLPMGKLTKIDNLTQGAGCCLKNQSNKSHQSKQSPHLSAASVYSEMQQ